jgi:hypothetical protein
MVFLAHFHRVFSLLFWCCNVTSVRGHKVQAQIIGLSPAYDCKLTRCDTMKVDGFGIHGLLQIDAASAVTVSPEQCHEGPRTMTMSFIFMLTRPYKWTSWYPPNYTNHISDLLAPDDPLGEAFHFPCISGTFYCRSEFTAPCALELPACERCLMFHVVTAGECPPEVDGIEPSLLAPGTSPLFRTVPGIA